MLDYVEVMDYHVWGARSNAVGSNAPLNNTCTSSANQQGSAVSAVEAWTSAGFPPSQIILGVASYGHSFKVTPSNPFASGSTQNLRHTRCLTQTHSRLAIAGTRTPWQRLISDQCRNYSPGGPPGIFDF